MTKKMAKKFMFFYLGLYFPLPFAVGKTLSFSLKGQIQGIDPKNGKNHDFGSKYDQFFAIAFFFFLTAPVMGLNWSRGMRWHF